LQCIPLQERTDRNLTFADEDALVAFQERIYAPEAAARIEAEEGGFLDRAILAVVVVVVVGEVRRTARGVDEVR
jgi:hypothetical protein